MPSATEPMPRKLLGLDAAADAYGLSRRSIEREIKAGRLAAVRYGRRVLVRPEDLDSLLIAIPAEPTAADA